MKNTRFTQSEQAFLKVAYKSGMINYQTAERLGLEGVWHLVNVETGREYGECHEPGCNCLGLVVY